MQNGQLLGAQTCLGLRLNGFVLKCAREIIANHLALLPEAQAGELDQSLSVNIRLLAALQMDRQYQHFDTWTEKISAMLRRSDLTGYFWFDKWHISPYYLTSTAVWSLFGVVDDLLPSRIKWILQTQREDGGWGYYHQSTVEETAYCLHALLFWNQHSSERIDPTCLHSAARYLMDRYHNTHYPPLWIGKSLYTPRNVVRSAVLAALYSYREFTNAQQPVTLFSNVDVMRSSYLASGD